MTRQTEGRGSPDPCRRLHHQEDVDGVEKGPPEGGAEEQLDPHLQNTQTRGSQWPETEEVEGSTPPTDALRALGVGGGTRGVGSPKWRCCWSTLPQARGEMRRTEFTSKLVGI